MDELTKKKHLLSRATFGLTVNEYESIKKLTLNEVIDALMAVSDRNLDKHFDGCDSMVDLKTLWLEDMTRSFLDGGLQSKMSFFWHNYFPVTTRDLEVGESHLLLLYKHTLGNFADLLNQIIFDPAFIIFLNLNGVKRKSPNENFARELLELFTLGIDNYSETDVQEISRCFTGWSLDRSKKFRLNRKEVDNTTKSFLGNSGSFSGKEAIDLLLKNKKTANFLAQKLFKFFVSSKDFDKGFINDISSKIWQYKYDIKKILRFMFKDDRFYAPRYIGTEIKSPVELIVHLAKNLSLSFADVSPFNIAQKLLGQQLFNPPNVGGWPEGMEWIDSNSLMIRLNLAQLFVDDKSKFLGRNDVKISDNHVLKKINANRAVSSLSSVQKISFTNMCYALLSLQKKDIDKAVSNSEFQKLTGLKAMVEMARIPEFQFR